MFLNFMWLTFLKKLHLICKLHDLLERGWEVNQKRRKCIQSRNTGLVPRVAPAFPLFVNDANCSLIPHFPQSTIIMRVTKNFLNFFVFSKKSSLVSCCFSACPFGYHMFLLFCLFSFLRTCFSQLGYTGRFVLLSHFLYIFLFQK